MLAGNSMGLILDARGVHNHTQDLRTVTRSAAPLLGRTSQVRSAMCSGDEIKEIESSTEATRIPSGMVADGDYFYDGI